MPAESAAIGVAVIGAGGAGLLAGLASARAGARTVLYERMKSPAKKVAISGGGRCNFSNSLDPRQFTVRTAPARFRKVGDLWQGLRTTAPADLQGVLEKFSRRVT